jgi:hypothetical protein
MAAASSNVVWGSARKSGKGRILEERLKDLMQELGYAINESLSDSDRIAGAIGEIRRAGYDVFLILEATIGFNRREDDAASEDEDAQSETRTQAVEPAKAQATGRFRWTTQDQKFLRALKIAIEDERR